MSGGVVTFRVRIRLEDLSGIYDERKLDGYETQQENVLNYTTLREAEQAYAAGLVGLLGKGQ